MSQIFSVICPKTEDHGYYDKTAQTMVPKDKKLFMFDEGGIYVYCQKHGWINFKFYDQSGKKISFKDVSVKATDVPNEVYLPDETMPVMAYGEFNRKKKKCLT